VDPLLGRAILCIVLGLGLGGWCVFMSFFTRPHSRVTDSENAFWVRVGLFSADTAEKFARAEKGITLKVIYAVLALAFFVLAARYLIQHNRLRSRPHHPLATLTAESANSSNQTMQRSADRPYAWL